MEHQASWMGSVRGSQKEKKKKKKKETGFLTIMDQNNQQSPTKCTKRMESKWDFQEGCRGQEARSGEDGHQFSFSSRANGGIF